MTTENTTCIRRTRIRETLGKALTVSFILLAALMFFSACANDELSVNSSEKIDPLNPRSFFPLGAGYSVTFTVSDANGQIIDQELYSSISPTSINGLDGVRWSVSRTSDSGLTSLGVIFWDKQAVYHQADGSSTYEVLLVSPIQVGSNWSRWIAPGDPIIISGDNSEDGGGTVIVDDGGSGTNLNNNGGDDEADPGLSSFFTEGSSTFYVAAVDEIVQSGGKSYSSVIQIINAGANQTVNRYWYAAGVGMIKYSLNCRFGEESGTENAERVQ